MSLWVTSELHCAEGSLSDFLSGPLVSPSLLLVTSLFHLHYLSLIVSIVL